MVGGRDRSADTMLPFYLQKWPPFCILTVNIRYREKKLIIRSNSACKVTSLSIVWWMRIEFCVREKVGKRDISVSFTKWPPSWILTITIPCREKWSLDWIQHAKLHLFPRFGEYISKRYWQNLQIYGQILI